MLLVHGLQADVAVLTYRSGECCEGFDAVGGEVGFASEEHGGPQVLEFACCVEVCGFNGLVGRLCRCAGIWS